MTTAKCDNCQWQGDEDQIEISLMEVHRLAERLDPGSEVPVGECPECGAFAYVVANHNRRKTDKQPRREQQTALDL